MKKLTLSIGLVAAILSAKAQDTEDIIQSIRMINTNDSTITKEISEIYVHNLLDVLSKLEDLQIKYD